MAADCAHSTDSGTVALLGERLNDAIRVPGGTARDHLLRLVELVLSQLS